ncbi:MAG: hypothetical protein ACK56I_13015, partial [bacterium]
MEGEELVPLADLRIGQERRMQVTPGVGLAQKAVDEHHGDLVGHRGLQRMEPGVIGETIAPEEAQQTQAQQVLLVQFAGTHGERGHEITGQSPCPTAGLDRLGPFPVVDPEDDAPDRGLRTELRGEGQGLPASLGQPGP